jgi:hypothetical protein
VTAIPVMPTCRLSRLAQLVVDITRATHADGATACFVEGGAVAWRSSGLESEPFAQHSNVVSVDLA